MCVYCVLRGAPDGFYSLELAKCADRSEQERLGFLGTLSSGCRPLERRMGVPTSALQRS